jgi:hypothetical protein
MSEVSRCYYCGAFAQTDDRFCWSCGKEQKLPEGSNGKRQPALEDDLSRDDWLALRRAYLLRSRGELDTAEKLLRGVLRNKPAHVPTLTLLSEIQRDRGDLVAAVETAQSASEAAAGDSAAPPGALKRAREGRAEIEESVLQGLIGMESAEAISPLGVFTSPGRFWYRSGAFFSALALLGLACLAIMLVAALHGHVWGYLWLGGSLLAAGWSYQDAESRRRSALFWGCTVLCLGPFGLAVYLLSK